MLIFCTSSVFCSRHLSLVGARLYLRLFLCFQSEREFVAPYISSLKFIGSEIQDCRHSCLSVLLDILGFFCSSQIWIDELYSLFVSKFGDLFSRFWYCSYSTEEYTVVVVDIVNGLQLIMLEFVISMGFSSFLYYFQWIVFPMVLVLPFFTLICKVLQFSCISTICSYSVQKLKTGMRLISLL